MNDWHVCSFTTIADVTLRIGDERFRFEWSDRFGPVMLGKRGRLVTAVPARRSPFWRALQFWIAQGTRVVDGIGLFEERTITRTYLKYGRHLVLMTPENRSKWPDAEVVSIVDDDFSGV